VDPIREMEIHRVKMVLLLSPSSKRDLVRIPWLTIDRAGGLFFARDALVLHLCINCVDRTAVIPTPVRFCFRASRQITPAAVLRVLDSLRVYVLLLRAAAKPRLAVALLAIWLYYLH
jgi:hypothetical protein